MSVTSTWVSGPSGGGVRIPREVEKMFCSDPVAERGINITQTEEDKVKHSDSHFLCISPSSEGLGWGGVGKCREERAMEALRGGPPTRHRCQSAPSQACWPPRAAALGKPGWHKALGSGAVRPGASTK